MKAQTLAHPTLRELLVTQRDKMGAVIHQEPEDHAVSGEKNENGGSRGVDSTTAIELAETQSGDTDQFLTGFKLYLIVLGLCLSVLLVALV